MTIETTSVWEEPPEWTDTATYVSSGLALVGTGLWIFGDAGWRTAGWSTLAFAGFLEILIFMKMFPRAYRKAIREQRSKLGKIGAPIRVAVVELMVIISLLFAALPELVITKIAARLRSHSHAH